jgi:hypothetical protein
VAEILIRRRRRRGVWPLRLLLILVAALLLLYLNERTERPSPRVAVRGDTTVRNVAAARDSIPVSSAQDSSAPVGSRAVSSAPVSSAPGLAPVAPAPAGPAASSSRPSEPARGQPTPGLVVAGQSPDTTRAARERTTTTSGGTIAPAPSGPSSFRRFIATARPARTERAYGAYAAEALERLAADLRALGASQAGVLPLRAYADSLQLPNTWDGAQADFARAAFLGAVHQFDLLRARAGARIDVSRLRAIAWQIDSRRPLVPQRTTLDRFFAAAQDALDSLARRR